MDTREHFGGLMEVNFHNSGSYHDVKNRPNIKCYITYKYATIIPGEVG